LLTEIHEIDLACWFFGAPLNVFCVGGSWGNDNLNVEDTIQATLIYNDFSIQITLCFMHRQPSRDFHIIGSKGDVVWSEQSQKCIVRSFDIEQDPENAVITTSQTSENVFTQQARKFLFDWSSEETKASLSAAFNSLAVVEAAKRSMRSFKPEPVQALPNILID
jgi:predicted dehydrogenase